MERNYDLGLYEKAMPPELSWREKLTAARESGFDFVEMSVDETDGKLKRLDMSEQERLELIRIMNETHMPIRSMCLSGHRRFPLGSHDAAIREQGMEIMKKAIRLADDLGIRIIQLAGYDVYYEEGDKKTLQYFRENLQKATEEAAKYGILMAFETMETDFMNTVEKAMSYVDSIASPYLKLYPDVGNITNAAILYGKDVKEDLLTGKGHIAAIHLKETKPGVFRDMHFGEGHVDFEGIIHTAWKLGVRRYVTEFWYQGSPQWRQELVTEGEKMRQLLDKQS